MEVTAAIILFIMLTVLGIALRKKKVDSATLQDWANIVTVSSVFSAVLVGAIVGIGYLIRSRQQSQFPSNTVSTMTIAETVTPSLTSTATSTFIYSSETPTSIATWTPIPSITPQVATTIFEDAFIDNRNNWYVDSVFPHIAAGKYTYKVICPLEYASFYCGTYIKVPFTFPKNFRLEIDATVLELSLDAKTGIGFQVRRNEIDYYYINYFITDGFYILKSAYNTNDLDIIPKTPTELIAKELRLTNRFGIEIEDSTFTPIINGDRLSQGEDGNLRDPGASYLIIYISRGDSAILQFDNIVVQEVK